MQCCCPHSRSAGKCFSRVARRYRRRFEKHGFERSQQQLLDGLAQTGYQGKSVLEVGSGVGHLHQTLLERGATSAIGIDLAPAMIDEARRWAEERGLSDRVTYLQGDFVELTQDIEPAQVTILDKVVCCYPDAAALLQASLSRTDEALALSYPRDRWYTRWGVALGAAFFALTGSAFRPYVHDPVQIENQIRAAGFEKRFESNTFLWLTQVFRRR